MRKAIAILLALAVKCVSQQPRVALSPVPFWPKDGVVTVEYDDQNIFYSPSTDELIIRYQQQGATVVQRIALGNQADPDYSVSVSRMGTNKYSYTYRVLNKPSAKAPLSDILVGLGEHDSTLAVQSSGAVSVKEDHALTHFGVPAELAPVLVDAKPPQPALAGPAPDTVDLVIQSQLRPGFVFAAAESVVDELANAHALSEVPEPLRSQAREKINSPWLHKQSITLGPRFGDLATPQAVAIDYLTNLTRLVRAGVLPKDSQFVSYITGMLQGLVQSEGSITIPAGLEEVLSKAVTPFEKEIAAALLMAFASN
ncbi:MAG: hypothetical protein JO217_14505 [Acidobacteriaceae bacterium]|nr:hypothetical protein [Acidobacteriaceae bacterium]